MLRFLIRPNDFRDEPYYAGLNQIGHMVIGGAMAIVFGVWIAAFAIASLELFQYYRLGATKLDCVADTAFWCFGMAFYSAMWFLPVACVIGAVWMGAVWLFSR